MGLFTRKWTVAQFWEWFAAHERRFYDADMRNAGIQREMTKALRRVGPGLLWQFDAEAHEGKREFVISADGIQSRFNMVRLLCDQAPQMERWDIVAFRQPQDDLSGIELQVNEQRIRAEDVLFCARRPDDGPIDVVLFVPGCRGPQDENAVRIAFLMLDMALGEYDVATKIGGIDVASTDVMVPGEVRRPVTELREVITQLSD